MGNSGQSKHTTAQEKDSWSLVFSLVQLSLVDEQKLPAFSEMSLNFKHIHLATSTNEQLEQHEHKEGWIPWLHKVEADPGVRKA